ncbi:add-1 [Cordylochernes scorpioides]|uniref:Add-1 n=1 Tax=Cordylochernes scorpioides TaxID=51811 RepID=A0ABY6K2J1_9ARAC|nr:add-1 [Cordylochernes scorpioides]
MGGAKSTLLVMPAEVHQLHLAVMRNDVGTVQQLATSVDVDFPWHSPEPPPSLKDGSTPLGEAVSLNHRHVVEVLLKCGASVNKPDNFGCTPLHKAAYHGRHLLTELLISMGADVGWVDHNLNTPLHICVQTALVHNSLDTVRTLLWAGSAVNQINRFGKAPLHYAALWALPELCHLLIQVTNSLGF